MTTEDFLTELIKLFKPFAETYSIRVGDEAIKIYREDDCYYKLYFDTSPKNIYDCFLKTDKDFGDVFSNHEKEVLLEIWQIVQPAFDGCYLFIPLIMESEIVTD